MKRDKQKIIVRVDGGICAQVAFVSMGLYLQEKFAGQAVVKYDLSWYREYGKDLTGKFSATGMRQRRSPAWNYPRRPKMSATTSHVIIISAIARLRGSSIRST